MGEIVGARSWGRLGGWEMRSTAFVVASAEVQTFPAAVPIYIVDKPQFLHRLRPPYCHILLMAISATIPSIS